MKENENEYWALYGYVIASQDRKKVISSLLTRPKTPSELSKENKLPLTRISNALTSLTKRNLVICLNPKQRKGKVYKLTEKGQKIAGIIKGGIEQ